MTPHNQPNKTEVSVTILTKNSAQTLLPTLEACRPFSEVILYDTGSTDTTLSIANEYPNVKIVQGEFEGFGKTHNKASAIARFDWILSIDSDEVLSKELISEILALQFDPKTVYSIPRANYFREKWIRCCSGWYPDRVVRLYHRNTTRFSEDAVHEKVLSKECLKLELQGHLLHTPYQSIHQFLHKMQLYSELFSEQNQGKKTSSLKSAIFHGVAAFLKSYFLKRGFLGGKEGFIISVYNGHTAYYKYLKLAFRNNSL